MTYIDLISALIQGFIAGFLGGNAFGYFKSVLSTFLN